MDLRMSGDFQPERSGYTLRRIVTDDLSGAGDKHRAMQIGALP